MAKPTLKGDISELLRIGFEKARLKFLEEKAKNNGDVIISDIDGNVTRVPAKKFLKGAKKSSRKMP